MHVDEYRITNECGVRMCKGMGSADVPRGIMFTEVRSKSISKLCET